MKARVLLGLLLATLLISCTVTIDPSAFPTDLPAPNLKPANTPDVMILAFAGRCGIDVFQCDAPRENEAYLDKRAPDGSASVVETLARAFTAQGYTVGARSYRSHLWNSTLNGDGYLQAQADLEYIQQTSIADYDNPTRLVLLGHSHGTNFASLLVMDNPSVTFDYFVYLDGVCFRWEADHLDEGYFSKEFSFQSNYPRPLNVLGEACNVYPVPGVGYEDIKDVVPDNVSYALEVRSSGVAYNGFFIKDQDVNTRTNGERGYNAGIYSIEFLEGHSEIARSWSDAMDWVIGSIEILGLSFSSLNAQPLDLQAAPAPEGWNLQ